MFGAGGGGGSDTFGNSSTSFRGCVWNIGGLGRIRTPAAQQGAGTGTPKWRPTGEETPLSEPGASPCILMSISAMEEYNGKSYEELRVEDYLLKRRSSLAVGVLHPTLCVPAQQQQQQGTGELKWQPTVHANDAGMDFSVMMSISAMEEYKGKSYEELRVEDYILKRTTSLAVGVLVPALCVPVRQKQQGTGEPQWQATAYTIKFSTGFSTMMSISAMKAYEDKSHEELRVEDYLLNRKPCTHGLALTATAIRFVAAGVAAPAPPAPAMFGGAGATQAPAPPFAAGGFSVGGFNHLGASNPVLGGFNVGGAVLAPAGPPTSTSEPSFSPVPAAVAFGAAAPAVEGLFGAAREATGAAGVVAGLLVPARRKQGTGEWRATRHPVGGQGAEFGMIMSISAMKAYDGKSHEELRVEDYFLNRKNSLATAVSPTAFGAAAAATAATDAAAAPTTEIFGGFGGMPANLPPLVVVEDPPAAVIASSSSESRFLDAVFIALNQACGGGEERWYVSTLELQLVSIELCRACRSVPTLHVCVEDETPRSLRSSEPVIQSNTGSWKLRTSRVPTVCARSLSWSLLTEMIAKELWTWLECLRFGGPLAVAGLDKVVWPRRIKELFIDTDVDTPVDEVTWPSSLKRITFGGSFNKPVDGVAWPAPMESISFGDYFDQPITGVVWPAPLQHLSLGHNFDQPITGVLWPTSLKSLVFGVCFNQPIIGVGWPASLQQLSFGYWFDQTITGAVWPPSLQRLSFGALFDQPIVDVVWPAYMLSLTLGETFDQCIAGVEWPASMQQLSFGTMFNRSVEGVVWPASLQQLSFGDSFNKSIGMVVWPTSLRKLTFGCCFNRSIAGVVWPASLQQLEFGDHFNKPIYRVAWPASLQELSFGSRFNQTIAGIAWPSSLKRLSFRGAFNQPIDGVYWPASLEQLSFGDGFNQPMDEGTRRRLMF